MSKYRFLGRVNSIKDFLSYLKGFVSLFFMHLGGYWLLIEILSFFFSRINDLAKSFGLFGVPFLFLWVIILRWPIHTVSERLNRRDVSIELLIGNFLEVKGDYIIGSTTSFDVSFENETVSPDSLIGKFIKRYYPNSQTKLQTEIEKSLGDTDYIPLPDDWAGNKKCYDIGTVARIDLNDRRCYLVGINKKNKHGFVHVHENLFEDIKVALAKTWEFVEKRGDPKNLVIPLLGTGRGRVKEAKIEVAKEIIKSFIAANSSSRFCQKLTIAIHPSDANSTIDIHELVEYMRYQCKYTEFHNNNVVARFV